MLLLDHGRGHSLYKTVAQKTSDSEERMGVTVSVLALPHPSKVLGATAKSTVLQIGAFAYTGSVIK